MLLHLALIYSATWFTAALGWAGVEAVRLGRLAPVPPVLDWLGLICALWVGGPLAAPLALVSAMRRRRPD